MLVFLFKVATIYKDASIGNQINIVIVKLIVVHNEQVRNSIHFNVKIHVTILGFDIELKMLILLKSSR